MYAQGHANTFAASTVTAGATQLQQRLPQQASLLAMLRILQRQQSSQNNTMLAEHCPYDPWRSVMLLLSWDSDQGTVSVHAHAWQQLQQEHSQLDVAAHLPESCLNCLWQAPLNS